MRLKIIAGNFLVVVVIGLVGYFVVKSQVEKGALAEVDQQIANDAELFARSFRLSGITFQDQVVDRAATPTVRAVFGGLDASSRRTRANQAANEIAQWFRDPSRRGIEPDVVAVTDETGRVIARNQDPNRMHGTQLTQELPALRRVLEDGEARTDVWRSSAVDNKVLQTSIAVVRSEAGAILGTLIVGYDLSNGLAQSEGAILGRDVAFVTDEVYAYSVDADTQTDLQAFLFSDAQSATTHQALSGGARSQVWQADLGGAEWVGVTAPLPMSPSMEVAYVVLANRSAAKGLASSANIILILTVLGALLVLAYGFIIGTGFLRPLEQIEEGVLAVINGRTDLRIDVESGEFGGLAYRINQLINVFTGVSEEDEDGRVSSPPGAPDWQGSAFESTTGMSSASSGSGETIDDPALAAQLAAEPEDSYYTRVYQEYVQAKTAMGENVSNIPADRFIQRLQGQAASLAKKHGCRMVRFQVETKGNQVSLRPVVIR